MAERTMHGRHTPPQSLADLLSRQLSQPAQQLSDIVTDTLAQKNNRPSALYP